MIHSPARGAPLPLLADRYDLERQVEQRMSDLRRRLVRDDAGGHFLPARAGLLYDTQRFDRVAPQQRLLAWLRDNVNTGLPKAWYRLVLGHDLHLSTWAELFVRHYHLEPDPFTGKHGWLENVGLVSSDKVTTAFRDFESAQLVTESALYGDFKWHEVGLSTAVEANTQTALTTTTGIARVSGTQTNPAANTYQSVATVAADTAETWEEHGLFNVITAGTLMDRSLISPNVPVQIAETVQFTYLLTKNAEA